MAFTSYPINTRCKRSVSQSKKVATMEENGSVKTFLPFSAALQRKPPRDSGGPLHTAVQRGSVKMVRRLIEGGADVDSRSTILKETPLHWAARFGFIECLELLACFGGSLTSQDGSSKGMTPLHLAILCDRNETAVWLLESGVTVDIESREGMSPLFCAIRRRNIEMVKVLLDKGANVNAKVVNMDGITPLHSAVMVKSLEIVQILLENGADLTVCCNIYNRTPVHVAAKLGCLNIFRIMFTYNDGILETSDEKGNRPIDLAASKGHVSVVKWLKEAGVAVRSTNRKGYAPLHTAACCGEGDVVKFLVEKGADVNSRTENEEGNTALHLSAISGYTHVVKLLLQMGADIHAEDAKNKYTAMHYAAKMNDVYCLIELRKSGGNIKIHADSKEGEALIITAIKYDSVDVVDWLLNTAFFLETRGERKRTLLHYAACNDSPKVGWLLVKRGAKVNSLDEEHRTPLVCAVLRNNYEIVSLCLSRQADPCIEDIYNMNAFHYAAMVGEVRLFKLLSAKYTLAPSGDKFGDTPLHLAASYGHVEVAEWLLDSGWPVDTLNKLGSTPLISASWGGHCKVAEMLLNRNANVNARVMNADNRTVLHAASFSGNAELVDVLLQKGASVNTCTSTDRRTALHWAVQKGCVETVRLLVQYGADAMVRDAQGYSAVDIARSKGYVEIMAFLKTLDK